MAEKEVENSSKDDFNNQTRDLEWSVSYAHTELLFKMGGERIEMAMTSLKHIKNLTDSPQYNTLSDDVKESRIKNLTTLIHSAIRA